MPEYKTFAEFLSNGTTPLLSVRGYEVYDMTFQGVTTYPVMDANLAEIIGTGKTLDLAVEIIVERVCMSLIKGVQV